MVRFKSKLVGGLERLDISIDNVLRFNAVKDLSGWNVWTLGYKKLIAKFDTLCEIEIYVEEMDK